MIGATKCKLIVCETHHFRDLWMISTNKLKSCKKPKINYQRDTFMHLKFYHYDLYFILKVSYPLLEKVKL